MTERLPPVPGPLTPEERALAARLARLGPHGEPSPALDARILAAARAGLASPAGPVRRHPRWPWAFGIAASVALAVGLAWQLRPLPERVVYDEAAGAVASATAEIQAEDAVAVPTPAPAMAKPLPPSPAAGDEAPVAFQRAAEPLRDTATEMPGAGAEAAAHAGRQKARTSQAPPAPAAPPAPPPAPVVLQAPAIVEPRIAEPPIVQSQAADMALPEPPPAAPATSATKAVAREAAARDAATARRERNAAAAAEQAQDTFAAEPFVEDIPPATADSPEVREAWLYRIRELRDAGRREEARESLMEYVARYPRHDIPDDLEPLLD